MPSLQNNLQTWSFTFNWLYIPVCKQVSGSCRISSLEVPGWFRYLNLVLGWLSCLSCLFFFFSQYLKLNLWSLNAKPALYHWRTAPALFWLFASRQVLLSFPGSPWKQWVLNLQSSCLWKQKTETSQWNRDAQTEALEMSLLELGILGESSASSSLSTWTWRLWMPIWLKLKKKGWTSGWAN